MEDENNCGNCEYHRPSFKWWFGVAESSRLKCQRYPIHVLTNLDHWCGEHEPPKDRTK